MYSCVRDPDPPGRLRAVSGPLPHVQLQLRKRARCKAHGRGRLLWYSHSCVQTPAE